MPGSADQADLTSVSRFLREDAGFLAGWLAATPAAEEWLQRRLRVSDATLRRLLICRAPQRHRFVSDVSAIARYVGLDATALAVALREAGALAALSQRGVASHSGQLQGDPGRLAAARDTALEQLPLVSPVSHVRELAEATWRAVPSAIRRSLDVDAAIAWASPAAVVSLRGLSISTVNEWLARHSIPALADGIGPLRGLLVAGRGHGLIFCDSKLSAPERRLTVAHEHGHLLDYLAVRQRALRDAPGLLEVLDGNTAPSASHRAQAALARMPLGLHTHLLRRDDHGGGSETTIAAEDSAWIYALEMLAPFDDLIVLLHAVPTAGGYAQRLRIAAEMVADRFELPKDAASARAASGLAALGLGPGFFDR